MVAHKQNDGTVVVAPLLRTDDQSKLTKSKEDVASEIGKHASHLMELAKKYGTTKDEDTRKEINRQSLNLHGEIHVFSKIFSPEEREALIKLNEATNEAIIKAAKQAGREKDVYYVNLNDIRAKNNKTAPEHLHEKLFYMDHKSVDSFLKEIEDKVLKEMKDVGYNEREFLRRLLDLKKLYKGGEDTTSSVQIGDSADVAAYTGPEPPILRPGMYEFDVAELRKRQDGELVKIKAEVKKQQEELDALENSIAKARKENDEIIKAQQEHLKELAAQETEAERNQRALEELRELRKLEGSLIAFRKGTSRKISSDIEKLDKQLGEINERIADATKTLNERKAEVRALEKQEPVEKEGSTTPKISIIEEGVYHSRIEEVLGERELPTMRDFILAMKDPKQHGGLRGKTLWMAGGLTIKGSTLQEVDDKAGTIKPVPIGVTGKEREWRKLDVKKRAKVFGRTGNLIIKINKEGGDSLFEIYSDIAIQDAVADVAFVS